MATQNPTSNYNWTLPTVGGSADAWGTILNAIIADDVTGINAVVKTDSDEEHDEQLQRVPHDRGWQRGRLGYDHQRDQRGRRDGYRRRYEGWQRRCERRTAEGRWYSDGHSHVRRGPRNGRNLGGDGGRRRHRGRPAHQGRGDLSLWRPGPRSEQDHVRHV